MAALAACSLDVPTTAAGSRRPRRRPTRRPARARRRSASSASARRTTSATTRPPTTAARRSARACPNIKVLDADNDPGDDNAATPHGADDRAGREDHLRDELRLPRRRRAGRRRRTPTSSSSSRATSSTTPVPANMGTYFGSVYETVYLGRHRGGRGDEDRQARLRLRLPDPADARQHRRLRARRADGQPEGQDLRRSHRRAGATRPSRRTRRSSLLGAGRRRVTQHQDCTGTIIKATEAAGAYTVGYHSDASLARPEGLAHRLRLELGAALHGHRPDGARRRLHRQRVQRQLPRGWPAARTRSSPRAVRAERHGPRPRR